MKYNLNQKDKELIIKYYKEMDSKVLFIESIISAFQLIRSLFGGRYAVVSNNIYILVIASKLKCDTSKITGLTLIAEQYFALKDAFLLLSKKGVPVYYYHRVGPLEGYVYSDSAKNRMKQGLNFPLMYNHIDRYENELKELFGDLYSKSYIEEIGKIPQVIKKGDIYRHEDYASSYVNVVGGQRIVCNQPSTFKGTIHIYGRCGVFGYAVEDKNSLPSLLQKELIDNGIKDKRVVNHGLWGGDDEFIDHNFLNECVGFKEGDVVVFYRMHIDERLIKIFESLGVKYKDTTQDWHSYPEAKWCFYDKPGHMNHIGYKNVARIICKDMLSDHFACKKVCDEKFNDFKSENLKEYLKKDDESDFSREIKEYTNSILQDYPIDSSMKTCGAIVVNCNPFTKGHRYLIELASSKVDRLYVFVVQEDKSYFKYEDREEMVRLGVSDLNNIVVISSGKFIISTYTFPEYFMKDYVKEKNFDVSMDVETFCKYIAPPLNIKKRFAGEEPFDPVTNNYNESMKRILPEYGMEFCGIPRIKLDEEHVINATEVRRLLKLKDFETIGKYVPETTLEVLKNKYNEV